MFWVMHSKWIAPQNLGISNSEHKILSSLSRCRLSLRSLPPPTCGVGGHGPARRGGGQGCCPAQELPSAVAPLSRLAFGGGDGHGELVSGGHGGARPGGLGELDPGAATGELVPAMGELGPGGLGELDPGRHGGARSGHRGAPPRPAAAPRLAVGGGDGHGELGPGGLGELDIGVDMGELDPRAMGELNPGGLGELAFGGGDGVGRGRVALVVRTQRWALCGDAEGPSEDAYLGSASAPTQNGSWVCLLRWSVFCLPKTLCTTHFWVWVTLCVCC